MKVTNNHNKQKNNKQNQPIFLVGWFRSGTTMFWNLLRKSGQFSCYYEPFHEHLLEHISFGTPSTDPTHIDVGTYWDEYQHIPFEKIQQAWQPWFGRERFVLDKNEDAKDMYNFIKLLLNNSPKRPVLKFVRANFRIAWLKKNFPQATIIFLARNPRAIWTSMVGRKNNNDNLLLSHKTDDLGFINYMLNILSEICLQIPGPYYRQFYALWAELYQTVTPIATDTWWYEDAINNFDDFFIKHLKHTGILNNIPKFTITGDSIAPKFHKESWYIQQEILSRKGLSLNPPKQFYNNKNETLLLNQIQELQDIRIKLELENHKLVKRIRKIEERTYRKIIRKLCIFNK